MKNPDGGYRTYAEMSREHPHQVRRQVDRPGHLAMRTARGPFAVYMYGVFMSEVAVEVATGKTTVEKMTLVADIGKVNNRWLTDGRCTAAWPRASAWP
jgi:aldehyde oxidoreductase